MRYLLAWLPMVLIAVGNGAFREAWLLKKFGEHRARQISTLVLVALFAVYIGMVVRIWPIASAQQAAGIGLAWLLLTLAFEFLLGRFVSGLSWRQMLAEYNLARGRLWALVPTWVTIAPYVFHRLSA